MNDTLRRWATNALLLLPVYGTLTLIATITQQPDPAADFTAWSEYVTTTRFYVSHLAASILGLALGTLGVAGLAVILASGRRPRAAMTALALHVLGGSVVLGLFGVAAFVQPAMGEAFLGGEAAAEGWYDMVFGSLGTLLPAGIGLAVFSAASVVMAWPLAADPRIPRWTAALFGTTAPFIGLLGLFVSVLQPLGSLLLTISGITIWLRVRTTATPASPAPVPPAGVFPAPAPGEPASR